MTTKNDLPELEACARLYRQAYREHGSERFTRDQLEESEFRTDITRLLDLSVAYGMIEFDGVSYRISVEPDAATERWRSTLQTHANRTLQALDDANINSHDTTRSTDEIDLKNETFGSVFISESDDFDSVVDSVKTVISSGSDGVVLRSGGEYANKVQRFADRLCTPSELSGIQGTIQFQKESSDVVGSNKDELEFRLFLTYV